jgi:hypothetical protein
MIVVIIVIGIIILDRASGFSDNQKWEQQMLHTKGKV